MPLQYYFAPGAYTGQWFETFAGGGDRAETRDRIVVDDLYAVEALNVQVPFAVGRELLEGQLGRDVGTCLQEIPTDVELGTRGAGALVADGRHADRAWRLLNNRSEKTYRLGDRRQVAGSQAAEAHSGLRLDRQLPDRGTGPMCG